MQTQNKKIGLLLRVSSLPQERDGSGLEVQEDMGRDLSKRLGFEPKIYNEGSQSTFRMNVEARVTLVEMLDDIAKGIIDKIWVFNLDRLGRESSSWYSIYKILLENQVKIYVGNVDKPYDLDSAVDVLTMTILTSISQYDNAIRRMRSVLGKRNALKKGQTYVGGTPPFGYKVDDNKMLYLDEEKSQLIKEIFEMYAEGKTTSDIRDYLNASGHRPPRGGSSFNRGTIQMWLGNTLYKGEQVWEWKEEVGGKKQIVETIKIKTPKIISFKLFDKVQRNLIRNSHYSPDQKKNTSLFGGLVYCKSCETKLLAVKVPTKSNDLYSCPSVNYKWRDPERWEQKHKDCTLKKSARVSSTDEALINHLVKTLKDSNRVRTEYKKKVLGHKFQKSENIRKKVDTHSRHIRDARTEKETLENSRNNLLVDIYSKKVGAKQGKELDVIFSNRITEQDKIILDSKREIEVLNRSSAWISWLDEMYLEMESLKKLPVNLQKIFVQKYLKKIDVVYDPKKQCHKFDYEFFYPLVEDVYQITGKNKLGHRTHKVLDGKSKSSLSLEIPTSYNTKMDGDRKTLKEVITKYRVQEKLSLNELAKKLNELEYKTTRGNEWNKTRLSSYIKYMKIDVGK